LKTFKAYGVGIESNLPFFSLPETEHTDRTICIQFQRVESIQKDEGLSPRPCNAQGRTLHIVPHESYVAVQVDLLFSFELWLSSNRIQCQVSKEVSDDLLRYWILQQILPLFLLLKGSCEFLHGMAVSSFPVHGGPGQLSSFSDCTAFLGQSHAGKSTLLNYYLSRGHALITDDHLALSREDYTKVWPSIPFYRPYRAAEDLGLPAEAYSPDLVALRRIYLLNPVAADADPQIKLLTGMDAITALFPSLHYSLHNVKMPDLFPLVEDRFRGLADIARRVPIARLYVPRSLERLPEVYDFIQKDQVSLPI